MAGWCEGFEEFGCGYPENKGTRAGWLEKVFRAGQGSQRFVVPIIIIIIITVTPTKLNINRQIQVAPNKNVWVLNANLATNKEAKTTEN
jgi:hypothetical protein